MTTTLLTGPPRSGTSLLCVLLNELPNSVALVEPMDTFHGDSDRMIQEIDQFVATVRSKSLIERMAPSRSVDGRLTDNTLAEFAPGGLRPVVARLTMVPIEKPLSNDFRLYIKHPAAFTALLRPLSARYRMFAIVRHPLACLASWQTVDIPLYRGRLPVGELFDTGLRTALDENPDRLSRQVFILTWFFQKLSDLPANHVLRYEDLLINPTRTIAQIDPAVGSLVHPVRSERIETRYQGVDLALLARAIIPLAPVVRRFYPDFESSLEPYLDGRTP